MNKVKYHLPFSQISIWVEKKEVFAVFVPPYLCPTYMEGLRSPVISSLSTLYAQKDKMREKNFLNNNPASETSSKFLTRHIKVA